jgi:hypothetical protein
MAHTEFYCQSGGSNLNAGSTTDNAAIFTFTGGDWVSTTGVFTAAGANLSGISAGMFASVYIDGASVAVFVGRITAVDDGADTITVSLTAKMGTAPGNGTGNRTIKVGGAWKGPNDNQLWPIGVIAGTLTNASDDMLRINFKNDAIYSVTATGPQSLAGPFILQGYTTTPGDLGKAIIDGGVAGTSYIIWNITSANAVVSDFEVRNNGATASATGLVVSGTSSLATRCVVHDVRGIGLQASRAVECEAYSCNTSNTANLGGMQLTHGYRCISHHNSTGSNCHGFLLVNAFLFACIADSNAGNGCITITANGTLINCDMYNNTLSGFNGTNSAAAGFICAINSNFIKNGGYGAVRSGSLTVNGIFINCGFGSGTQANSSGDVSGFSGGAVEVGKVVYGADVTPWADPADGDFSIVLSTAKGTGAGSFFQTQSGYGDPSPTVSYPDIGAGQHYNASTVVKLLGIYT